MKRSRPYIFVAGGLIAAVLADLCVMAPRMYPLHADSPANFWYAATGVDLGATRKRKDLVIVDRERLIYSSQYPFAVNPDYPYETISLNAAEADFPAVQLELARRAARHDPEDYYGTAYTRWLSLDAPSRTIPALLGRIDQERIAWISQFTAFSTSPSEFQEGLQHVADAERLYWATILFEAILFSGLILFALWPYIHHAKFRRKLLHAALFPLLLYLPMWFGYCNLASPAFPIGGILYPYINRPILSFNFDWEWHFLTNFPPFFVAITQGRTLSFPDYQRWKLTLPYQVGPVSVMAECALVTLLAAMPRGCVWLYRKLRRERRGFPVVIGVEGLRDGRKR